MAADMLLLFAQGGDVNWTRDNQTGASALHELVAAGNIVCADFYIQNGAQVEAPDSRGNTPLHIAAQFDHAASARLLLLRGASHTRVNQAGQTPLQVAETHHSVSSCALFQAVLDEEQAKQKQEQDRVAARKDKFAAAEPSTAPDRGTPDGTKRRGMLRTIMSFGGSSSEVKVPPRTFVFHLHLSLALSHQSEPMFK